MEPSDGRSSAGKAGAPLAVERSPDSGSGAGKAEAQLAAWEVRPNMQCGTIHVAMRASAGELDSAAQVSSAGRKLVADQGHPDRGAAPLFSKPQQQWQVQFSGMASGLKVECSGENLGNLQAAEPSELLHEQVHIDPWKFSCSWLGGALRVQALLTIGASHTSKPLATFPYLSWLDSLAGHVIQVR